MRQENVGAIAKTNRRRQRLFSSCVFIGALGMTATASAVDGCKALLCPASPGGAIQVGRIQPLV